jgi:hypothetical protein
MPCMGLCMRVSVQSHLHIHALNYCSVQLHNPYQAPETMGEKRAEDLRVKVGQVNTIS